MNTYKTRPVRCVQNNLSAADLLQLRISKYWLFHMKNGFQTFKSKCYFLTTN